MTRVSSQALQQPIGNTPDMGVISLNASADERAQALAQQLSVPFVGATETAQPTTRKVKSAFDFELLVSDDRTVLQPRAYNSGPIGIDFDSGRNLHRLVHSGGRKQTLVKAVGIKRSFNRQQISAWHILDTTSGFCRDSWALASIGCQVTALERCAWLHDMQLQALKRAADTQPLDDRSDDPPGGPTNDPDQTVQLTASRITPLHTDAIQWLQQLHSAQQQTRTLPIADVIYIDPMYPERKKSAAVKKEMQALHLLLGPDIDSDKLVAKACKAAELLTTKRIVVKRPVWAEPLPGFNNWQVLGSHASETTRYDVYLRKV